MTRKSLAERSGISERYLANLELQGVNASALVLRQVADALGCSIADLIGDETTSTEDWRMIRDQLTGCDGAALQRALDTLTRLFPAGTAEHRRVERVALIGARGAGKSALGRKLADEQNVPFVELTQVIEQLAGCSSSDIYALYGPEGYRRYERQALQYVVSDHGRAIIALPADLAADSASFRLLCSLCFTVWLQVLPSDALHRLSAQARLRPPLDMTTAITDLERLFQSGSRQYNRADLVFNTSGRKLPDLYQELRSRLSGHFARKCDREVAR